MSIPENLKYSEDHEWIRIEGDVAFVGITDFAQSNLGDIVFIELPAVNDETTQMEPFGTIEAVKAVSDLYAPLTGTVVEVNERLNETPELINQDPFGDGWILKIKLSDTTELESLLSPEEYTDKIS